MSTSLPCDVLTHSRMMTPQRGRHKIEWLNSRESRRKPPIITTGRVSHDSGFGWVFLGFRGLIKTDWLDMVGTRLFFSKKSNHSRKTYTWSNYDSVFFIVDREVGALVRLVHPVMRPNRFWEPLAWGKKCNQVAKWLLHERYRLTSFCTSFLAALGIWPSEIS